MRQSACIICRCTEYKPCKGGCSWFRDVDTAFPGPLCTTCWSALKVVATWLYESHRPSAASLILHARRIADREINPGSVREWNAVIQMLRPGPRQFEPNAELAAAISKGTT